ncbi:tetratricopeptide repeat protein [Allocoleopsis sp.]|uniref:tetratricopeptide repeat protein n=1 Tax=Allocoleopsis sp. TaxID=3088169 RepID=UPI002FD78FF1
MKLHQVGHKSKSFASYFNLGVDYRRQGNMQKAIEAWTQALHIDSTNTHAYYDRGITKAEIGDYIGAIEDLERVIHLNPKYFNAYRQRLKIYQECQNVTQSISKEIEALSTSSELHTDSYGSYSPSLSNHNGVGSSKIIYFNKRKDYDEDNSSEKFDNNYDIDLEECDKQEINNEYHDLLLEGEEYTESTIRASKGWFYTDEDYDSYESFVKWNG